MDLPPSPFLTAEEVADYLRVSLSTVYHWRQNGLGPSSVRIGKHLRYRREDVESWLKEREGVA